MLEHAARGLQDSHADELLAKLLAMTDYFMFCDMMRAESFREPAAPDWERDDDDDEYVEVSEEEEADNGLDDDDEGLAQCERALAATRLDQNIARIARLEEALANAAPGQDA